MDAVDEGKGQGGEAQAESSLSCALQSKRFLTSRTVVTKVAGEMLR
jgi:hypothetical protein